MSSICNSFVSAHLAILVGVTGFATSCTNASDNGGPPANLTEILWVPPGATLQEDLAKPVKIVSGRSIYADGSAAVVFTTDADGVALTNRIVKHVSSLGWRQRRTQYLNPQLPTSFDSGWQVPGGGVIVGDVGEALRRGPYRRWHGEWEDDGGNIREYDIGGQGRQLSGRASYVPRRAVESGLRKLGR